MSEEHVERAVETAQDVADSASTKIRQLNPGGLASLAGDAGWGFFTLSVALYAGAMSFNKFRGIYHGRNRAVTP